MTTTQQATCNTAACADYGTAGINMGSKTMREIMDADTMGHAWAKAIIAADRKQLKQYYVLNPGNGRANLYGALALGINATYSFNSSDDSVKKQLTAWLQNLNKQFPAMPSYTPATLGQRIADLEHASHCIGTNTKELAACGELTQSDTEYLSNLATGLQEYADAAKALLKAVEAAPCKIDSVGLNIPSKQH